MALPVTSLTPVPVASWACWSLASSVAAVAMAPIMRMAAASLKSARETQGLLTVAGT